MLALYSNLCMIDIRDGNVRFTFFDETLPVESGWQPDRTQLAVVVMSKENARSLAEGIEFALRGSAGIAQG